MTLRRRQFLQPIQNMGLRKVADGNEDPFNKSNQTKPNQTKPNGSEVSFLSTLSSSVSCMISPPPTRTYSLSVMKLAPSLIRENLSQKFCDCTESERARSEESIVLFSTWTKARHCDLTWQNAMKMVLYRKDSPSAIVHSSRSVVLLHFLPYCSRIGTVSPQKEVFTVALLLFVFSLLPLQLSSTPFPKYCAVDFDSRKWNVMRPSSNFLLREAEKLWIKRQIAILTSFQGSNLVIRPKFFFRAWILLTSVS